MPKPGRCGASTLPWSSKLPFFIPNSKALELLMIANDAGLPIEIQSWGHSLAQAANLHLMLANERTQYFEAAMPKEAYEFGMKNGILLDQGQVVAPERPGLGIEVDWDILATADFYVYSK